jgi:hypothetical protein
LMVMGIEGEVTRDSPRVLRLVGDTEIDSYEVRFISLISFRFFSFFCFCKALFLGGGIAKMKTDFIDKIEMFFFFLCFRAEKLLRTSSRLSWTLPE